MDYICLWRVFLSLSVQFRFGRLEGLKLQIEWPSALRA